MAVGSALNRRHETAARQILNAIALGLAMHNMDGSMQAGADAYTAVCIEPYSRTRALAGFSSAAGQDAASETAALGGIATMDIGTKRLVSKVCPATCWHTQSMTTPEKPRNPACKTFIPVPLLSSKKISD